MYVPINIVGGSYAHRSRKQSAQVTRNWWPQKQEGLGEGKIILEGTPGLTLFSAVEAGHASDRGMIEHKGILYKVSGTRLSSVASDGTRTTLGTITGSGRCIMDALGDSVLIANGDGDVWEWNGSTLTAGSDVDFETPTAVTVINKQAIYDGDDDRFCVSDVGLPLQINGLNYATAEVKADDLLRPYAFNQNVYMFGEKTIETWWNSGQGKPPFDRIEGGLFNIGLAAVHSVASNDNHMYWLGDDKNVYSLGADGIDRTFTPLTLVREFANYSSVSDAIGWCMTFHKQNFYFLKFPSANRTWVYPEGGEWFQLSSSTYESGATSGRHKSNSYAFAYGRHLMADEAGNILEFDEDAFDDNGDTIKRIRDTAPIHGGLLGMPGKEICITEFKLIMETGVGTVGANTPTVSVAFSEDGGRTFGTEYWNDAGDVGDTGDYLKEIVWSGVNITGTNIVVRITASADVYYSIHDAAAEIEIGI